MEAAGDHGKRMRAICLMAILVLGIFVEQSEAALSLACVASCTFKCVKGPFSAAAFCAVGCMVKCLKGKIGTLELQGDDPQAYCKIGCATTRCAHLFETSLENIREDEMEGCLDDYCSSKCLGGTGAHAPQINN